MSESVTNLSDAVAACDALPLAGPICTQAEARAAGLDIAPSVEELDAMASSIVAVGDPLSAEVSLAQAVPLLGAADEVAYADTGSPWGAYRRRLAVNPLPGQQDRRAS